MKEVHRRQRGRERDQIWPTSWRSRVVRSLEGGGTPRDGGDVVRNRMRSGGRGQLASFVALLFLPFIGRAFLGFRAFAFWALLNTVITLTVSLDLGGTALVTAQILHSPAPKKVMMQAVALSCSGTVLIGVAACAAWIPYSHTQAAAGWTLDRGFVALSLVVGAGLARSVSTVIAGAALAFRDYRTRDVILVGQAVGAVALAAIMLTAGLGVWSLPMCWLASCGLASAVGLRLLRARNPTALREQVGQVETYSLRAYVSGRTAVTLLGGFLTQADRWFIGVAGGSRVLSDYELAWRAASVPRLVILSLTSALISEARHYQRGAGETQLLLRHSLRYSGRVIALSSVLSLALAGGAVLESGSAATIVVFTSVSLFAFNVNALTAPVSAVGVGLGKPSIDVPYLTIAALGSGAFWAYGAVHRSPMIAVLGASFTLALCSGIYLIYGLKWLAGHDAD